MKKKQITVFTPTFNRKMLLKRVFNSLQKQTNTNFKWLIIDDGSTDGTNIEVENFKKKAKFEIIYYCQKNGGKHRAHNTAVKMCDTKYLLILDSDDYLTENAIEVLLNKIAIIDNMDDISGIIGNRFNSLDGKVIGTILPNIKFSTGIELYQKRNFRGDTLRMYKNEILKNNLFPEIPGEKFVYENVVFDKIDKLYKMLIIHDKLYIGEYQNDGYTQKANKLKRNNPKGYALSLKSSAETAISLRKKINWTLLYIIWCYKTNCCNGFKEFHNKILFALLYPIAIILNLIKIPKFFFNVFKEEC